MTPYNEIHIQVGHWSLKASATTPTPSSQAS